MKAIYGEIDEEGFCFSQKMIQEFNNLWKLWQQIKSGLIKSCWHCCRRALITNTDKLTQPRNHMLIVYHMFIVQVPSKCCIQNAVQMTIFWFLFENRMKKTGWHDLSSGDMKFRRQTKLKGGAHFSLLSDSEGYFDKNHRGLYCHPSQDQVEVIPIYLRVILPDIDFWIQNYLLDINQPRQRQTHKS